MWFTSYYQIKFSRELNINTGTNSYRFTSYLFTCSTTVPAEKTIGQEQLHVPGICSLCIRRWYSPRKQFWGKVWPAVHCRSCIFGYLLYFYIAQDLLQMLHYLSFGEKGCKEIFHFGNCPLQPEYRPKFTSQKEYTLTDPFFTFSMHGVEKCRWRCMQSLI